MKTMKFHMMELIQTGNIKIFEFLLDDQGRNFIYIPNHSNCLRSHKTVYSLCTSKSENAEDNARRSL